MATPGSPCSEHTIRRRIFFYEVDSAGIVHFSNYFRYMEEAEHALWRAAGLSIAPHGQADRGRLHDGEHVARISNSRSCDFWASSPQRSVPNAMGTPCNSISFGMGFEIAKATLGSPVMEAIVKSCP